jgi:hypothetical protein
MSKENTLMIASSSPETSICVRVAHTYLEASGGAWLLEVPGQQPEGQSLVFWLWLCLPLRMEMDGRILIFKRV